MLTDPALLERAVANLVSNALAWSPDARAGAHRGRPDRRQRRTAHHRPRARHPAGRARPRCSSRSSDSATARHDAGAGLGLAIAKGFVEVTGGRLELDDTPGGGCTFSVIIPIAPDGRAAP